MNGSRSATTSVYAEDSSAGFEALRRSGFARARAERLGLSADHDGDDFRRLSDAFADLPPDPYDSGSNRFRRYSQIVYLPWNRQLFWVPGASDEHYGTVTEYDQNGFNPEYRERRRFPDVPAEVRANKLLEDLIRADIAQVLWLDGLERTPIYAGVHMVKLAVRHAGDAAVTSPSCLHQDGGDTMFTFVHLVHCRNVRGGENIIAAPECAGAQPEDVAAGDVHARFTLTEPLETYAVHDHRVSHYVSPVRSADGTAPGERAVLIIGVAPYVPRF